LVPLLAGFALLTTAALSSAPPLDATLKTSKDQQAKLSDFRGEPTVVLYGGRKTEHVNDAFDHQLVVRLEQQRPQPPVHVIPVADLHDVNYWPVRGIALKKVTDVEQTHHIPVLLDWNQTLSAAPWNLPTGKPCVVLLDAKGVPVFQHIGQMGPQDTEQFFQRLNALIPAVAKLPSAQSQAFSSASLAQARQTRPGS
jgi:hypothetical protein